MESHRRTCQFFLEGLSHLCHKNFSTAPEKTPMVTCKTTLPDSPHPVIISKNPRFRALYLARQNEFRFFRLINTNFFFIFGRWLLREKFSFCPKNNGFARVWRAAAPQTPGSYAYVESDKHITSDTVRTMVHIFTIMTCHC